MHGRIIQLSLDHIEEEDELTANDIIYDEDSHFIGHFADYVVDSEKKTDINWFIEFVGNSHPVKYTEEEQSVIFNEGFKESYFKKRFETFKKTAQEITLEDFVTDKDVKLYSLKSLMEDKYSFYIWFDEMAMTLDTFIRDYLEIGKKYYLGGTVDYHC